MPDVSIEGARCAVHPQSPATGTCARCGNFVCDLDTAGGTLCASCRSRTAPPFPFTRDTVTIGGLWEHSLAVMQREWVMLSLAALIIFAVNGAVSTAGQMMQGLITLMLGNFDKHDDGPPVAIFVAIGVIALLVLAVQFVAQGALNLGFYRMLFDAQDGKPVQVSALFSQVSKLGRYLVAMGVVVAVSFGVALVVLGVPAAALVLMKLRGETLIAPLALALLVLVVVAIYFSLPLQMLLPMIVEDESDAGGLELLRRCYAVGDGHRLDIFGVGLVGGLVMLAGLLACCVGGLPAFGMSQLLVAGLYRGLRNGPV